MKVVIKLLLFTLLVTGFYTYVGQMVPQTEVHPPKDRIIRSDMTTEEMIEIGQDIVGGKGTCLGCHTIGSDKPGRFPDLGGIGARAGKRKPGMTDVEYLAEALYEPSAYIVEGFTPGMPTINKSPIGLSDPEILTVIAYLQSLGGTPSVTIQTHLKYASPVPAANPEISTTGTESHGVASALTSDITTATKGLLPSGIGLLQRNSCRQCHAMEKGEKSIGPNFFGVGSRLQPAQIYEAIMDPDASTVKGYPKGLMAATLKGSGFYDKTSAQEIKAMVEFLATQKGKGAK